MTMTIIKPTLFINKERARRNIKNMARKAEKNQVRFRPHFKTHQSWQVGEWFREFGVTAITVSSVDMAIYFAEHGWKNITIAFPLNIREIEKIHALSETITLNLLIESEESARFLREQLLHHVNIWLKIDCGYHRTGLLWEYLDKITSVSQIVEQAENMTLCGILTHSGHTYKARSQERVREIYTEVASRMKAVQQHLQSQGCSRVEISVGDTPGCCLVDDFGDVDEIRPGNFVFFDTTQWHIGSCSEEEIAVAVACPVVAKHQERHEIVIYGGGVHLSKESMRIPCDGAEERTIFGHIALPEDSGWGPIVTDACVVGTSQEHGIVKVDEAFFNRIQIGDVLMVLPVHSCLTVNLMRKYHTFDGVIIELADLS